MKKVSENTMAKNDLGHEQTQSTGLSRALDRGKSTRDPFAEGEKQSGNGQMRARAAAKIRAALFAAGEDSGPKVPGTTVSVARLEKLLDALDKQAQARETKIGRQARRVLTFLQKDKRQDAKMVSGVNIDQFKKLIRMVQRDGAQGQDIAAEAKARRRKKGAV